MTVRRSQPATFQSGWRIRLTEVEGDDRHVWYLCMGVLLLGLGEAPAEWEGKAAAKFKVGWVITVDNKQQP